MVDESCFQTGKTSTLKHVAAANLNPAACALRCRKVLGCRAITWKDGSCAFYLGHESKPLANAVAGERALFGEATCFFPNEFPDKVDTIGPFWLVPRLNCNAEARCKKPIRVGGSGNIVLNEHNLPDHFILVPDDDNPSYWNFAVHSHNQNPEFVGRRFCNKSATDKSQKLCEPGDKSIRKFSVQFRNNFARFASPDDDKAPYLDMSADTVALGSRIVPWKITSVDNGSTRPPSCYRFDHVHEGVIYKRIFARNLLDCRTRCHLDDHCYAANYRVNTRDCEFSSTPSGFMPRDGYVTVTMACTFPGLYTRPENHDCFLPHFYNNGYEYDGFELDNHIDCKNRCLADNRCVAFNFDADFAWCSLLQDSDESDMIFGVISGNAECFRAKCIRPNTSGSRGELSRFTNIDTVEKCIEFCKANPACRSASMNYGNKVCWNYADADAAKSTNTDYVDMSCLEPHKYPIDHVDATQDILDANLGPIEIYNRALCGTDSYCNRSWLLDDERRPYIGRYSYLHDEVPVTFEFYPGPYAHSGATAGIKAGPLPGRYNDVKGMLGMRAGDSWALKSKGNPVYFHIIRTGFLYHLRDANSNRWFSPYKSRPAFRTGMGQLLFYPTQKPTIEACIMLGQHRKNYFQLLAAPTPVDSITKCIAKCNSHPECFSVSWYNDEKKQCSLHSAHLLMKEYGSTSVSMSCLYPNEPKYKLVETHLGRFTMASRFRCNDYGDASTFHKRCKWNVILTEKSKHRSHHFLIFHRTA